MKLCRYGKPGAERPALVDDAGALYELSSVFRDIGPVERYRLLVLIESKP